MIKVNYRSTAPEELRRLAARIPDATEAGMDAAGKAGLDEKKAKVRRTYRSPVPRSGSGRLRWVRSGAFLAGQVVQRVGRFSREILTNNGAARYEGRLADLPTGPDGLNRTNAAAEDARAALDQPESPARTAFEKGFSDHLGL